MPLAVLIDVAELALALAVVVRVARLVAALVFVLAAAQGPAALVPEPVTYLRAVVKVAAPADEGLALAPPDGDAALVAVLPEAIAADLRVRLVALAFFVHAPEARRHGDVVQGCPQGGEGSEH
jgi:hypothetical protein